MTTIYLDNAATSFPKPPAVAQAVYRYLTEVGASINRGVYASAQDAGLVTLELREGLCRLFGQLQQQLQEQAATLQAQQQDADELIQLKEEQIKLLEAQLAENS